MDDNERLCAMEPRLRLRGFRPSRQIMVGQRLTHLITGAPIITDSLQNNNSYNNNKLIIIIIVIIMSL